MKITWLGHASLLIESGNTVVYTDPVFSRSVFGLRRKVPFPRDPATLPDPMAVLVSHAHYDHLDLPSFKYFSSRPTIVLPKGLGPWLSKFSPNRMIELDHGATERIDGLEVSALPVAHTGWRLSGLRFRTCNGYVARIDGKSIFFPGDTGYRDFREDLKQPVDIALLPIGAYNPPWMMKKRHCNPEDALRIFEEIGARIMIPIHYGTFKLSAEPLDEPIAWLRRLSLEKGFSDRVKILAPGESFELI